MPEAALAAIFATSFIVGLSGSLMPGPLLALNISEVARRGFWAGPLLVLGHAIVEFAAVVALAWGAGQLLGNGLIAGIIGLIGGAFLVWMGFGLLRTARRQAALQVSSPGANRSMGSLALSGILVSISNPFWVLWWFTVGAAYVLWSLQQGVAGVSLFYLGHIFSDLGWYTLVSIVIATGRRMVGDAWYRGALALCGLALFVLGGYFMVSGIGFLQALWA